MDDQISARLTRAVALHGKSGRKPTDRDDIAIATDVIRHLVGESGLRTAVGSVLGELIDCAHHHGDRKWAVTLFHDRIRLNVGPVHVGVLLPEMLFLTVDPTKVDARTREALGARLHQIRKFKFPGSALELYLPVEEVADLWPKVREASLAFVDAAAARDTSFRNSHSPGVLKALSKMLGRELPQPAECQGDDKAVELPAIIARANNDLPPERVAVRERALESARSLIKANRGSLSADALAQLMRLFNTDHFKGRDRLDRFGMAMCGHALNRIVEREEVANHWINTLWNCGSDQEVATAIDQLRADSPLPYAGLSFPAMLLHCKEPRRYFPASSGTLATGYSVLVGTNPVDGETYVGACQGLRQLMTEYSLSPMGLDVVAYFAANPRYVGGFEDPEESETQVPLPTSYTREQFLSETLFADNELREFENLLQDKPQLVLYGPPGTGKTWIAERLARLLTYGEDDRIEVIQFHPSYGYEDFIEGIRPTSDGAHMTYPIVPGVFRALCARAERSPEKKFVLVIDELNRGNLPRIFGELLFALERRGSPIKLSQSQETMTVPPNIIILGTMNTADQSIALLDMALRRRFHFVRLEPDPERLGRWLAENTPQMQAVAKLLRELNLRLRQHDISRDRLIGHSHFMRPGLDENTLPLIWRGSISPLIEELFHGRDDVIDSFEYDTFVPSRIAANA
ncbi:MAG TPA: AAA family ATPase [Nannocystis exedens]|nr:AAA family ATPase [Nannocystis exedens]